MKTYAYGFPRLGEKREFKKIVEKFWKGKVPADEVMQVLGDIQNENIKTYKNAVDIFPAGEISAYDPMLDTAVLCGMYDPQDLKKYYQLCRGSNALEMTKWFNTNYHYLVPDFNEIKVAAFKNNRNNPVLKFKQCGFAQFIGPFTFLKLSKGLNKERFTDFFMTLIEVYSQIFSSYDRVQLDEPAFVMDLEKKEIDLIKEGYSRLGRTGCKIVLMTYYDSVDFIEDLLSLPFAAIGLDFVHGKSNFDFIKKNGFPADKTLIAGLVDGRNIWKNDIAASVLKLKELSVNVNNLIVSNAAPLFHLPISISLENQIPSELKNRLSFAREKLQEIKTIAVCFENGKSPGNEKRGYYGSNVDVQNRIKSLNEADFLKKVSLDERRKIHEAVLKLPLFPTTTIGSFPQTREVRKKRAELKKGNLSPEGYKTYIQMEIDKVVKFQEDVGLDVLVHGEFERSDMVEFFAQKLEGLATTENGWIISYGTRCYRPPIIFGDVFRPVPMTVEEITYAQSKTKKPVKGMLTGAVTIIAWSFCREDIPASDVAYQIALCLKDEIRDYEKAGIKIVQVDEPAFREKAPIKKRDWSAYFDWAVNSFNLTTNTDPKTQIHTHMCYSEFGEIMQYVNQMDFDVISIETSRSKGDIINRFENVDFRRQIGLGVWDIHSPAVPSVEEMMDIVKRALRIIPKRNFWLNPDCGLKTRDWLETQEALQNLIYMAEKVRLADDNCRYCRSD